MALVRRIAWRIMILGSWSRVGAPRGRHRWQPCSLIGVACWGDWYSSDRAAVSCIVCGGCSRWWWRQWPTVIWIYTGGELWEGGRGRWGRGKIGHATILEIAWAIRAPSSVLLIIVNTAIETVTIISWWPLSIGACCSAAVPFPQLRAITAKPTRGRRQPTYVTSPTIRRAIHVIRWWRTGHPVAAPAITRGTVWGGPAAATSHVVTVATVPTDWTVFRPVTMFPADIAAGMISHSWGSAKPTGGQLYTHQLAFEGERRHAWDRGVLTRKGSYRL